MSRAEMLLGEFNKTADEVAKTVGQSSEQQWQAATEAEGWPVGVVARHIALGYLQARKWIETLASGQAVTMTRDDIERANETNRGLVPDGKQQTIEFLAKARQRLVDQVSALSDEQFDREEFFAVSGQRLPVEAIVRLALRHARRHLASIKATLATPV